MYSIYSLELNLYYSKKGRLANKAEDIKWFKTKQEANDEIVAERLENVVIVESGK